MSSDNGIYIAQFPDGYRVAYAMCIDNLWFHRPNTKARKKTLESYFGDSKVYKTLNAALKRAKQIYDEMEKDEIENGMFGYLILEYGICILDGVFENWYKGGLND
jgi:hypothetical protein